MDKLGDKSNYYLSIFDIDDFKVVNDEYGHICGDHMLVEIAEIAKNNSTEDFVSRFGGEEFIVITKIDDEAIKKIEDIRKKIEEHVFKFNGIDLHATITIGVAKYDEGMSIDEWIIQADKRLYDGKTSGKNKVVFN
jgi:diguanylate cyclase (GGDEF)-like protein